MENTQTTPVADAAAEILSSTPKTQAEANEQMSQLLRRLISDTGRHEQQIRYLSEHGNQVTSILSQDMQYLLSCIRMLFEHEHLEMPVRQPPLLDAKVELIKSEDKDPAEQLDLQVALRTRPHPIYGAFDAILAGKPFDMGSLQDKISERLIEAFGQLDAAGTLVRDEFYYVRLHAVHAVPVGEGATAVDPATLKPATPTKEASHDNAPA